MWVKGSWSEDWSMYLLLEEGDFHWCWPKHLMLNNMLFFIDAIQRSLSKNDYLWFYKGVSRESVSVSFSSLIFFSEIGIFWVIKIDLKNKYFSVLYNKEPKQNHQKTKLKNVCFFIFWDNLCKSRAPNRVFTVPVESDALVQAKYVFRTPLIFLMQKMSCPQSSLQSSESSFDKNLFKLAAVWILTAWYFLKTKSNQRILLFNIRFWQ